jgi:hypothetical protein
MDPKARAAQARKLRQSKRGVVHISVRRHCVKRGIRILQRELIANGFVPKIAQRLLRRC